MRASHVLSVWSELPEAMSEPVWRGLNLAVLYGLGLIFGAVAIAIAYMVLCHLAATRDRQTGDRA